MGFTMDSLFTLSSKHKTGNLADKLSSIFLAVRNQINILLSQLNLIVQLLDLKKKSNILTPGPEVPCKSIGGNLRTLEVFCSLNAAIAG